MAAASVNVNAADVENGRKSTLTTTALGSPGHPNGANTVQRNGTMTSSSLSPETERRIRLLFPPNERDVVRNALFEQCGNNLPFLDKLDDVQLERFRFAVLKLSEGRLDKLAQAIALAKTDWRDLLVAADFADDPHAHLQWFPEGR